MARKSNASAQRDFGPIALDREACRRQQRKRGRRCPSCSRQFPGTREWLELHRVGIEEVRTAHPDRAGKLESIAIAPDPVPA